MKSKPTKGFTLPWVSTIQSLNSCQMWVMKRFFKIDHVSPIAGVEEQRISSFSATWHRLEEALQCKWKQFRNRQKLCSSQHRSGRSWRTGSEIKSKSKGRLKTGKWLFFEHENASLMAFLYRMGVEKNLNESRYNESNSSEGEWQGEDRLPSPQVNQQHLNMTTPKKILKWLIAARHRR